MKNYYLTFVSVAVFTLFSNTVLAEQANENTLSSTATLKVINPIVLTQVANLDFGTMGVGWGGSVTLSPENGVRTAENAVYLLPGAAGHAANYSISGLPSCGYIVTYDPIFEVTNSLNTVLTVTPSIFIPSAAQLGTTIGTIGEDGKGEFRIGGSVTFPAETTVGDYQGTFNVTVNYN